MEYNLCLIVINMNFMLIYNMTKKTPLYYAETNLVLSALIIF